MADLCFRRSRVVLSVVLLAVLIGATPIQSWAQAGDPGLDLYYNANSLCHRRFYKQAVDEYKRFLTKYPTHAKVPLAKWGMAISYYYLTKAKEAEPLLAELAGNKLIKAQGQLHNLWGSCLLELNKPDQAEKAFSWTIGNETDPKAKSSVDAQVGLVQAYYLQNKWTDLVTSSDALLKNAPTSRHADTTRFYGAVARSKLENYADAATVFEKLIASSKDTRLVHRATFRLAECKHLTGKYAEAVEMYTKVAKTSKGVYSQTAHYDLGVVHFLQKDYKKAIEELQAFERTYRNSALLPKVRLYLGRAYLETKEYNRATDYLKRLSNPKPNQNNDLAATATLWLARTYSRQNSSATVVTILSKVIDKFAGTPEMPGMLNELATAQMRLKKYPEAAALFGRARAASKGSEAVEFLRLQAFCLNQARQYAESMKLTEDFLANNAADKNAPEVLFIKGENLLMLKKPTEALAVFMKFLEIAPKHARVPLANFRVAQIHVGAQQWASGAKHLELLLAGDHKSKIFNQAGFLLGDCYFHLSKWDESIAALENFLYDQYNEPNTDTAVYNLSLACERKKLNAKAIAILRDMVSRHQYVRRDDKGQEIPATEKRPRRDQNVMRQVLQKSPHLQKARVQLGKLLYEAGVYPEAESHLTAAVRHNQQKKITGDGNAEYYLGWVCLKQNKLKEAANAFGRVAAFPDHPFAQDAALQCSILHIRNKDVKSAEAALKKMMSGPNPIKADQGSYYLGLAMARQEDSGNKRQDQQRYLAAMGHFDTVLTKFPNSDKVANALYWKGKCLDKLPDHGGPAKAAEIFAQFIEKHPKHKLIPDVTVDMGRIQFEAKKYDAVIAAMKKLLDPDAEKKVTGTLRENALYLLGWSYSKTGKAELSAAALEEMTALQAKKGPVNASASFQAGEARMKMAAYEEALKHFRRAAATGKGGPTQAPAMLRQAECEALTNKWEESRRTCTEFLKLFPNSPLAPQVTFTMGWALENRKEFPQAIEQYRKVIARNKNDVISARAQFQIGECLFVSNKLDEAITELIRVETKYSFPEWSAKALLELGRIREVQKDEDEAIKRYNEVIERFPKSAAATVAKSLLRKLQ